MGRGGGGRQGGYGKGLGGALSRDCRRGRGHRFGERVCRCSLSFWRTGCERVLVCLRGGLWHERRRCLGLRGCFTRHCALLSVLPVRAVGPHL